jgi:hypothetical protein
MEWLKWAQRAKVKHVQEDSTDTKYFDPVEDGNDGVQIELTEYCPLWGKSI